MGAQDKLPMENTSLQRVKVYRLSDDGKWDDRGTGHVTVDYLEQSEELGLFVVDEEDNETLLVHRISSDDIYRKQEDTIISWRDPEYSTELALSFQEPKGCSYICYLGSQNNTILGMMKKEEIIGLDWNLNLLSLLIATTDLVASIRGA
ncbi:hypothetical protein RHSIM_Rhsim02G0039600 [Rhododendron simsii]|uniref:PP4R3 EVH1-like domain-containing protein n=1 Tax=Rhododendron simsii TaxID=118357 RepID=A0A834H8J0_RHOSS|nr:hypothetical protein RHSIM_Rhsim02G0039600 [Rhododendron simsii]